MYILPLFFYITRLPSKSYRQFFIDINSLCILPSLSWLNIRLLAMLPSCLSVPFCNFFQPIIICAVCNYFLTFSITDCVYKSSSKVEKKNKKKQKEINQGNQLMAVKGWPLFHLSYRIRRTSATTTQSRSHLKKRHCGWGSWNESLNKILFSTYKCI